MPNGSNEKLQMIGAAIVLQAEQQRKEIMEKANQIREQEINACKEQVIDRMFVQLQQQTRAIRQKAVRDKAQVEQAAHRGLLRRREELADQVFETVRTRLLEYAAAPAYREELLRRIAAHADKYDHAATTLQLRSEDLGLSAEIEGLLPGCRIEAAKSIKIGGFRLRNAAAGVLVDETLDLKLEEQRPWFLQNCGLKATG